MALDEYREAAKEEPGNQDHWNGIAWLLATCPDAGIHDGREAVSLATRGCELAAWASDALLDTLACAHAEVGEFPRAVELARRALDLARAEAASVEAHLRAFEAGRPWREEPRDGRVHGSRLPVNRRSCRHGWPGR